MRNGILRRIGVGAPYPEQLVSEMPAAGENAPMQLYVGNTNILSGGTWTSQDGIIWERNDTAPDHYIRYENNILTLKNATVLGEFNASGNVSGAGIYAVGQLKQSLCLTIELLGDNAVSGFSGIAIAANHSSGKDAALSIKGPGSLTAEGAGVVDGGIAVRASNGAASLTIENASVKASGGTSGAGVLLEAANNCSAELTVNVSGGSLTASGSDSYGGISYYCGAERAAGYARLRVGGGARVSAVSGIKAMGAMLIVSEAGDGGGIVFDGTGGTVYGQAALHEKLVLRAGETLLISSGASLNTGCSSIVVESGGKVEGYVTGEVLWKVSGIALTQNSLSLKQNEIAELQAPLEQTCANGKITWSSIPDGVVRVLQSQTDGTKASVRPLKEGKATLTVADGGRKIALCSITVQTVENKQEDVVASESEKHASGAGIYSFFNRRKRNKK